MKGKNDDELKAWAAEMAEAIKSDILPKMRSSAFVMCPVAADDIDPFMLIQIGAALLLEKPLILVVLKGAWIPQKAWLLADEIVEVDAISDPAAQRKVRAAVERVAAKREREERRV